MIADTIYSNLRKVKILKTETKSTVPDFVINCAFNCIISALRFNISTYYICNSGYIEFCVSIFSTYPEKTALFMGLWKWVHEWWLMIIKAEICDINIYLIIISVLVSVVLK